MKLAAAATLGILAIVSSRRAYAQAEVQLTVTSSGASKAPAIVGTVIQNRYYVTFPGYDETSKVGFSWDGKDHAFTLKVGEDEIDVDRPLTMRPVWTARH